MDTKLKGDIAEQACILSAMQKGWSVLRPIGDRLPYDLVIDINGVLVKVQVKSAWKRREMFYVDTRRTQTNRRQMKRSVYSTSDFDFACVYIEEKNVFYIFPVADFVKYGSEITLSESQTRQRKPSSTIFREAWECMSAWAARRVSDVSESVKFGEAANGGNPEPSLVKARKV